MKIFIHIVMVTILLLLVGCNKLVKAPVTPNIEVNQTAVEAVGPIHAPIVIMETPTEPIEEEILVAIPELEPVEASEPLVMMEEEVEPDYDLYQSSYNDESLTDGVASKIVILKSRKIMVLFDENENILSRHRISLGKNDIGTKLKRGDYKTPEGVYNVVNKRSDKKYYKQIRISYPNKEDIQRSKELGFHPGSGITIHAQIPWNWDGARNDYTLARNWTQGCIAMTNEGIDMIWNNISPQTIVDIRE